MDSLVLGPDTANSVAAKQDRMSLAYNPVPFLVEPQVRKSVLLRENANMEIATLLAVILGVGILERRLRTIEFKLHATHDKILHRLKRMEAALAELQLKS